MRVENWPLDKIKPYERNARIIPQKAIDKVAASIKAFGFRVPLSVASDGTILAGHTRLLAAKQLGIKTIPVEIAKELDKKQQRAYRLADNRTHDETKWDDEFLKREMQDLDELGIDLSLTGFDEEEIGELFENDKENTFANNGSLAERFGVPPFSVLNAREGWWQARKDAWLSLGIQSELGRNQGMNSLASARKVQTTGGGATSSSPENWVTNSIFDPVLCELVYRWFCPAAGKVIDPFAGGSVRGLVAGALGLAYTGVDLRAEQVKANQAQAKEIHTKQKPVWFAGDSVHVGTLCKGLQADLLFTCPPYGDLEKYSEHAADLSNMPYDKFLTAYYRIIKEAAALLRNDAFAAIVVGEIRDKKGNYRNFVGETVSAFLAAGLSLYNEAILVTMVGSLPVRAGKQFTAARKLGKTHQNLLVFIKGDAKKACAKLSPPEFGDSLVEPELTSLQE